MSRGADFGSERNSRTTHDHILVLRLHRCTCYRLSARFRTGTGSTTGTGTGGGGGEGRWGCYCCRLCSAMSGQRVGRRQRGSGADRGFDVEVFVKGGSGRAGTNEVFSRLSVLEKGWFELTK
jgi:hypothetical protein